MKKLNNIQESSFLKLFFLFVSFCFLVAAPFMPDRAELFSDLKTILFSTCKISTNYFSFGYAATFLNMGIVGLICTALCCLPGAKPNNVTTLGVLLTVGFACLLAYQVLMYFYVSPVLNLERMWLPTF